MIEETDFEIFLYISKNKYQIFVYDKNNLKNLYNKELKITEEIELNNLSKFLDENIYKIEKMVNGFVENVILIIEDDKILDINLAKKKNYEKNLNQKYLENDLIVLKDIFRENYPNQIIMHMVIVDSNPKKNFFLLKDADINDDHLYIEVNFISISNSFASVFEKLLESHQIKIRRYMSNKYIRSFFGEGATEFSAMANELINGLNKNEVTLISKNVENKGFFEKFFQLFS